ncbi:mitochondrial import receptor subunit TOM20 homolog [Contarinia nasturtii]|uniref:mitochondrial import receptor subunit TOM20 homolog n=1 Tax=Contarinia nasturtii TaxID=265458 RepID=UPI0012D3A079|nr:mitochondrial import receptor subunit TOM20 homolog [Contarinia nasturtii]
MNLDISRVTLGIAAGIAGTIFISYCIYFDKKRRGDPGFKKRLYERRQKAKECPTGKSGSRTELPNLNDHEAVQRFFLQEIQAGEALISSGDFEQGVTHLANAVVVCGQPTQLLQVLQQTLPSQVFTLLISRMREYGNNKQPAPVEVHNEQRHTFDLDDDLE